MEPRQKSHQVGLTGAVALHLHGWCGAFPCGYRSGVCRIGDEFQVEVTKKDSGQQVVISQAATEWCLLIDVTPEHVVMLE